jgi:hypothetical protein
VSDYRDGVTAELRYGRNLFHTWQQIARELVKLGGTI